MPVCRARATVAEREHSTDDRKASLRRIRDPLQSGLLVRNRGGLGQSFRGKPFDRLEHAPELAGETAAEGPHGRDLVSFAELLLHGLALRQRVGELAGLSVEGPVQL